MYNIFCNTVPILGKIIYFGVVNHLILKYLFPIQFEDYKITFTNYLSNSAYNLILNYSKFQIFMRNKYNNFLNTKYGKYVSDYISYSQKNNNNTIELVKNDNIYCFSSEKILLLEQNCDYLFDFFIYSDFANYKNGVKPSLINKVIYFKIPTNLDYSVCNYKFISTTIHLKDKIYNIKFQSETENYFVENNKINKLVICYLLRKQFNVNINSRYIEYILEIIDGNANIFNITEKDELLFDKDKYNIINNKSDVTEDVITQSSFEENNDSDDDSHYHDYEDEIQTECELDDEEEDDEEEDDDNDVDDKLINEAEYEAEYEEKVHDTKLINTNLGLHYFSIGTFMNMISSLIYKKD